MTEPTSGPNRGRVEEHRITGAHFEPIAAIGGLQKQHVATAQPEHALDRSGDVLVHAVRELDDDDRAFAGRTNQPAADGSRSTPELSENHLHDTNSSNATEAVQLIPRDVLFGNPERLLPTLSPDGTRLAFVAPAEGVLNVWVGPADDPAAARPVTFDRDRGVHVYDFCHDDRTLVYLQDTAGDEDWQANTPFPPRTS
jgi:hypothetical protein